MGKKIDQREFGKIDHDEFIYRLNQETMLLQEWFNDGILADNNSEHESGFELEVGLLNENYQPAANNLSFIKDLNNNLIVSEAVQSSVEINLPYDTLHSHSLEKHQRNIENILKNCHAEAKRSNQHVIAIGTIPTAKASDFKDESLTNENRYHAINHRLSLLRDHVAPNFNIQGNQELTIICDSFALVGAINSFQIHFSVGLAKSVRLYNASLALSAPLVAISANSPFMFGHDLWEETRIPFYENILTTRANLDKLQRVSFGSGYVKNTLMELFNENLTCYVPLLPQVMTAPTEKMAHLQLHNGNIYRWNRPVLDFNNASTPCVRVEHRPLSSGPSVVDMVANAAFYFGLTYYHITSPTPLENAITFEVVKNNFYQAAKHGLDADVTWLDEKKINVTTLILKYLLPQAKEGLKQLDIDGNTIDYYLSIIEERISKKVTGSRWQREFYRKNNSDFFLLVASYIELQLSGKPVHDWPTE